MLGFKMNISEFARDLNAMTSGPNSIYRAPGQALRNFLLDEFKTLVYETPQYSGSTAASWRIGFGRDLDTKATLLPKPKSWHEALEKGSEWPCMIAISNALTDLPEALAERYMRQDIVLANEAPGFDTAEEGPVRAVNTPPGMLKRFEARVATAEILVDFQK